MPPYFSLACASDGAPEPLDLVYMGPPLAGPSRVMEICQGLGVEQTEPTLLKLPKKTKNYCDKIYQCTQANQRLVGRHNDAAHEELVEICN